MDYEGAEGTTKNAQGWQRFSKDYFRKLLDIDRNREVDAEALSDIDLILNEPKKEIRWFSEKNVILISQGKSPIVNDQFVYSFLEYEQFIYQTLVHHNAGEGGQAFDVPQAVHVGVGGVHSTERNYGNRGCRHNM